MAVAVIAIGLFLSPVTQAGRVVLVENGAPRAVIVIPDDPIPVHVFAARELRYHVKQATGADLPLFTESEVPEDADFHVYIGAVRAAKTAWIDLESLPPSGYVVRTRGNALFLVGRDREIGPRPGPSLSHGIGNPVAATWQGSLYAVYDFLETEMGVRWLWPGELGEHIPIRTGMAVGPVDRRGGPRLRQAEVVRAGSDHGALPTGWHPKPPEHHAAYHEAQRLFLIRHRFGATENLYYGPAFTDYWARFGKTHPEFFQRLPDGMRRPLVEDASGRSLKAPTGKDVSMCVSEPSFHRQILEEWESSPARNPDNHPSTPYVNACENDTPGLCICARCRAWDAPDPGFETHDYWGRGIIPYHAWRFAVARGSWRRRDDGDWVYAPPPSLSDRYARFYVELLRKAREIEPDARVAGYAYANYWKAPVDPEDTLDLNGVLIVHVPPLQFPYTPESSAAFRESWLGWRRLGAELLLCSNVTRAGANLPIFYARQLAADFSFAAEHGMIGTRFDSLLGAWSAQGPTMYTLVRLHVHPDGSADRILDEYYAAFGPAEAGVRAYFGYWERHSDSLEWDDVHRYDAEEKGGEFENYVRIAHRLFKPEHFAEARVLLNEARRQAAGEALTLRRVAYLEQGLTDAERTTATRAAQARWENNETEESRLAFENAFRRMRDHRRAMEASGTFAANTDYFAYREHIGADWPHRPPPPLPETEQAFHARWPERPVRTPKSAGLRRVEEQPIPAAGWKFRKDPDRRGDLNGWHRPETDGDDWREVEIETAWASFLGEPYIGVGWYRRALDIPALPDGDAAFLYFVGVDESAWVWVNGKYVGRHHLDPPGWDVPFRLDITSAVRPGKNVVVVRAMNTAAQGGIWQPVRLEIYEPAP